MKANASILAFLLILAAPVNAADSIHSTEESVASRVQLPLFGHSHPIGAEGYFCGTDFESEEARANLAAYRAARDAGAYPLARKGGSPPNLGDIESFNVSETDWISLEFELVDITNLYYLWVEVAELTNGNVQPSEISQFRSAMHDSTPSRSINPSQGIFANNHDVFGLPPNVDGDGLVDILMYDIGRGTGTTIGYVSPSDLLSDLPDGVGNSRDVLYLDSKEGTASFNTLFAVAAHEYTHLIHQAFGSDQTFISEGYAEYAIVMNGSFWRGINYTSSISEVSQPLFNWRTGGGPGARDYERGGLFFTYVANRVGHEAIGEMLRDEVKKGAAGLDSVLAVHGSSLSDVILDFHTANFLNDQTEDVRFGYNEPERSFHHTFLTSSPINGEIPSSQGEGGFTEDFAETIEAGSVHYLRFSDVANFNYVYDTPSPIPIFLPDKRLRNRVRALLRHHDGTFSSLEMDPSDTERTITGEFDSITFVFIHESPSIAIGDQSSLEAAWTPLSFVTDREDEIFLPSSTSLAQNFPNPFSTSTRIPLSVSRSEHVRIEVFDLLCRSMSLVANETLAAGTHSFSVDADTWPAGMYLIRMSTSRGVQHQTMTLIR